MRTTLLGPQRRPTVDQVVADIPVDAPIATVTAGWLEREPDDVELDRMLGGRSINLGLHQRWLDVLEHDHEYATAELEHRAVLDELQALYLVQLDHGLRALYEVSQRAGLRRPRTAAVADALAVVRLIDERHRDQVWSAHADFGEAWRPSERPSVAAHADTVKGVLRDAAALVIAGGHVGVLVHVLRLFGTHPPDSIPLVAWSAGAMALTERIVLFHDRIPHGPSHAELYDDGLGVIPRVVLLPHARRRLRVDDRLRMSILVRRFEPATCVVLDDGTRLDLEPDGSLPPTARVIDSDGHIGAVQAA
ncbi:MAG TPA: hypothetical protein VHI11_14900 [Jiangellaceae bacterium]|nr:hypothetical protein [Jiangellaceae bacterium]